VGVQKKNGAVSLHRRLVRWPRSGASSWECAPPLNYNPEGRWRTCVGTPALSPALCTPHILLVRVPGRAFPAAFSNPEAARGDGHTCTVVGRLKPLPRSALESSVEQPRLSKSPSARKASPTVAAASRSPSSPGSARAVLMRRAAVPPAGMLLLLLPPRAACGTFLWAAAGRDDAARRAPGRDPRSSDDAANGSAARVAEAEAAPVRRSHIDVWCFWCAHCAATPQATRG
jgi:hypothetical protein